MTIRIYNTLSRSIEDFVPENAADIRMYVCGPTVYDDAHIGNARPVIVFDVLFRLLRSIYGASHVTYARNITDVDDKINQRAALDFPGVPLNDAIRRLTDKTEERFRKDVAALLTLEPTHQPRATDNIAQMQDIIRRLVEKGHAYASGGEVLFSVGSMPDYGRLSARDLSSLRGGARVAVSDHKRDPSDFVLWKASSPSEPGWESPWGYGRPGWHIECSAMSARYLGSTFDIHGGGHDLIFPHHENEIAQSRCAHGTDTMARYWLHNGFVLIDGRKMSKSDGNFVTIDQLLNSEFFGNRRWPGEVLRLSMLMTGYREPLDFTASRLVEAETLLSSWPLVEETKSKPDAEILGLLSDDLDTVGAIRVLHSLSQRSRTSEDALEAFSASADLLSLGRLAPKLTARQREVIERLVASRSSFIGGREWQRADGVRDHLASCGIELTDFKDRQSGERRVSWRLADPAKLSGFDADMDRDMIEVTHHGR